MRRSWGILVPWLLALVLLVQGFRADAATFQLRLVGGETRFELQSDSPRWVKREPISDGVRWTFLVRTPRHYRLDKLMPRGPIRHVTLFHSDQRLTVDIHWRFQLPELVPTVKATGISFVIPRQVTRGSTIDLAPGLQYQRISRWTDAGPLSMHFLRAHLGRVTVTPVPAYRSTFRGLDTLSRIATRYGALAGVNGSFFSPRAEAPIGLLFSHGEILSGSFINRSVFGIRRDGTCFTSQAKMFVAIGDDRGKVWTARAVNRPALHGGITLYTPHWGARTGTKPDPSRREWAISRDGEVLKIATGNMVIPRGGHVISVQGKGIYEMRERLTMGTSVVIYARLTGRFAGAWHAIAAGPTLLENGDVKVTAKEERLPQDIARGRAARTAIGYMGGQEILLATIDQKPGQSVGMTLYELARLLREAGCKDAVNLDGGPSTTMVLRNGLINQPRDGKERPIHNALLLFPHDATPQDGDALP
ncbi:MAG: phosphodiester glycosidase family protein [Candidatus Sericytochromatia bacterium]|nr:phosphodiester glycosidase family protein [Candidatus Sericytochromatia bacterium]